MRRIRQWLLDLTGGGPILPLVVLFGLNAVDELDRTAFAVLLPEIRDEFGLDLSGVLTVVALIALVSLLLQVPVASLADRKKRVTLAWVGALAWSGFSLLTGLAMTLLVLGIARAGSGIGKAVVDPTHNSLLADYYDMPHRPRVYSFHRAANAVGAFVGAAAAGLLAAAFDWRVPFIVFAFPTLVFVFLAWKLQEPQRGHFERRAMGLTGTALNTDEPAPSFAEAWRIVWKIETLRRIWWSLPFLAASLLGFASLASLQYEQIFGLDERARGFVAAAVEPAQLVGLIIGARVATRLLAKGPAHVLGFLSHTAWIASAGLVVFALAPNLGVAVVANAVVTAVLAILVPGIFSVLALAIPPRARSMGFSVASLWVIPGLAILPVIGWVGDRADLRAGMLMLVPAFFTGGLLLARTKDTIADDVIAVWKAAAARAADGAERGAGRAPLLTVRELDVGYSGVQVLFGVDLEVAEGECVALLGTNGAGKSTLLKAISGIVEADRGVVLVAGRETTHAPPNEIAALGVAQVPGGAGVFPTLTVAENLRMAGWLEGRDRAEVTRRIDQATELFPILRARAGAAAGDLSGGQQQMLALAMALVARPRLLLIDELSLGLAPTIVAELLELVRDVLAAGTTVVLVEQSVNVALQMADTAVFLEKGEVRFRGPTAQLLERPDVLRSVFLEGAAAGFATAPGAGGNGRGDPDAAGGRGFRHDAAMAAVLVTEDLTVSFGGIRAVDRVDLAVFPGEVVGIIGPNGAGKTTLFDLVSGFVRADEGRILLAGADVTGASAARRARHGLGRSFQDARLFPSMTVTESVAVACERFVTNRDPLSAALRLPGVYDAERAVAKRVEELLDLLGLARFRQTFVRELSTGTRRIVDLACLLAHRPSVVLLDEPSSGIAQREAEALAPLLRQIRDATGAALVVVEHDMPLVRSVADRLVAMDQGAVVADGLPDHVLQHPAVVAAYLGTNDAAIGKERVLMMPSTPSPEPGSAGSSTLRRYGPIAGIVAVIAIIGGVVLLSGGDDDEGGDATTGGATSTTAAGEVATPNGAISFSQAEEQGLDVTFNAACDTATGRVAMPYFFAPECYADAEPSADWQPSRGVSADAINVVVYVAPETDPILDYITAAIDNDDTNAQEQETMAGFVAMFQAHYQTYGRTVDLTFMQGSGTSEDQVAARADAVRADEEFDAFAVFGGPTLANAWTEELNARDVICIGCPAVLEPEPNVFTILSSAEQNRLHIVEYLNERLVGRPAEFAGDETMRSQERVFGHLYIEANEESAESAADLRARLEADGITLAEQLSYVLDPNSLQEQAAGIIARFRDAGVTSLIIQTDPIAPSVFTQVATLQQWFPEWILTGSTLTDTTAFGRTYDQQQWAHAFGLSQLGARTAPGVGGSSQLYAWFTGGPPPADDSDSVIIPAPAVFFAGLQLAGPDLDVESMRTGLLSLVPSEVSTITQPGFSYGDHGLYPSIDYAGIDDFTEVWWDPTVAGDDEIDRPGTGMWRYVDGGRRYRLGEWGEQATPVFELDGTITVYTEPPASEQVLDYPPPG